MSLILRILSFDSQPYTDGKDVIFDQQGGTIGRSEASTLILPDENKLISRCHATVQYDNGQYTLTDSSLAGVFIDDAIVPINNETVQLVDGMHIGIGDYIIVCSISNEASPFVATAPINPFVDNNDCFQAEDNALLDAESNFNSPFLADQHEQDSAGSLLSAVETNTDSDVFPAPESNLLLDSIPESEAQSASGLISENISSLNDNFIPTDNVVNSSIIGDEEMPEDFNFEDLFNQEEGAAEHPSTQPEELLINQPVQLDEKNTVAAVVKEQSEMPVDANQPLTPAIQDDQLLLAFLRGAQIENENIELYDPVEKMTRIGSMFRQFVDSTVNVLRNRAEFKSLFRVSVTTIKRADNNPLKFAVTTDEALKHLINDGQGGFKKSVESIDEGFNDLLNHQLAMQAGIQASLTEILRQFDPMTIENQYKEGIVLQKKSKCWEKYNQIYAHLSETAVDDFFGDAFSEAYEQQMKQLKN